MRGCRAGRFSGFGQWCVDSVARSVAAVAHSDDTPYVQWQMCAADSGVVPSSCYRLLQDFVSVLRAGVLFQREHVRSSSTAGAHVPLLLHSVEGCVALRHAAVCKLAWDSSRRDGADAALAPRYDVAGAAAVDGSAARPSRGPDCGPVSEGLHPAIEVWGERRPEPSRSPAKLAATASAVAAQSGAAVDGTTVAAVPGGAATPHATPRTASHARGGAASTLFAAFSDAAQQAWRHLDAGKG